MIYLVTNIKQIFHSIYILFKNYKDFIKVIILLFFLINLFFFLIYFNYYFLIFLYNNIFISILEPIIYISKENYIKFLKIFYNFKYNFNFFIIQKYYSIIEYNFLKSILRDNNNLILSEKDYSYKKKFIFFLYKKIFFPYLNIFQNTEYYKKFDPKLYSLDFIYSYKRKGDCAFALNDNELVEYLPDEFPYSFSRGRNHESYIKFFYDKMENNYNYIFTSNHVRKNKSLYSYNDLFLRRNFFIIENNNFSNKELLHYAQDLQASTLDEMSLILEDESMGKISAFNVRIKNTKERFLSFQNFNKFEEHRDFIAYQNSLLEHRNDPNFDTTKAKQKIDKFSYKLFMNKIKKDNYYDNLIKITILEKDIDNFYITGTTEIYYYNQNNYRLIKFIGLNDYFFYYLYYSFIEIPFFFEDFYVNINKNTNILYIIKLFFNELIKINNFYVILIFFYSFFLFFRTLILNELDLLYSLLFLKRHLTFLIIIGFVIKFNLDVLDPLSFELFLLIWIPVLINYIVHEEWWWIWWSNYEKVKYHYTYNYEGVLYGPINIYIVYIITPSYFQSFIIFKLFILHYLIFHFNRIDLKWKYIIRKNLFFYFFLLYNIFFFNLFFFKEELNLLKSRFKLSRNLKTLTIFEINFNIYSRNFLSNNNNLLYSSILIILKKYIQFFIYYLYTFFFIFIILLMLFKILYNLSFIFYITFLIKNNLDFINANLNFYLFIKNNLNLALFKEYQIIQRSNYYKYSVIYEYKNINGLNNKLYYKFHYPGLIFYRTSRQFNGNIYWLFFQGGHNFIGENYYKATIMNSFYKKNLSYFYKYFLFDSKNHTNWNLNQKTKYERLSNLKKKYINLKRFKRLLPNYSLKFKTLFDESDFKQNDFNFINYNDIKFITLISKNFYKTTSYYTNNKTSYFSLYTYKYYCLNYPLSIDDYKVSRFIRRMHLYSRAWGTYHMGSNFLPVYGKFILKGGDGFYVNSSDHVFDLMNNEFKIKVPFKNLIKESNIKKIEFYNKYIPNRIDYIKFHSISYEDIYLLYKIELAQTILDKDIIEEEEIEKDNSISIFTLLFDYKEYIRLKTERDLSNTISITNKVKAIFDRTPIIK